ncbi:LexA-binding, inner membrane-associated putative hydrolase [Quadrisphaera granulorum]|uniref:LexA-binding, inner membrane-associated putative hydrolase n=1 Tax=Quadrisphaera granulorum TaxID=317664 RepID=A0A315ZLI7_9ACTN|nr:metal-dependent hydrolase [Quadrisphaera granulorum]PWJ46485.1 LexA-binding, inner membrane-associated putative hydrolase [Quadrisphaera granulorum]SZE99043.1 LexA-binding, inner membrane-associated putative hydrolase [Quadrisphaera granulorum]
MLGHSHAMSGLAAGAATLPWAGQAGVTGPVEQLAWVAAWGGFAMLPDLDQGGIHWRGVMPSATGSTVARMWGPVTTTLASVVGKIAGGHRQGTHDLLLAPVIFGLLTVLATHHPIASMVVIALGIGLALQALHVVIPGKVEQTVIGNVVISALGAWWVTGTASHTLEWLPWAVAGGVVVHILGDWLTVGGVPVPLTWVGGHSARLSAGLFKTGARAEHVVATMFAVAAVVLVVIHSPLQGYVAPVVQPVLTSAHITP